MSVAAIYEGWPKVQKHLVHRLPELTREQLNLKASAESWPIWALVGHLAGARVYWLCHVLKEPGADNTPFADLSAEGWEDHLDHPRRADELLLAVESTWKIIESCLDRWTPDMLGEVFTRDFYGMHQQHTRHSVLTRLVMHDSFHAGEVSLLLGMHGLESLDPWEPL